MGRDVPSPPPSTPVTLGNTFENLSQQRLLEHTEPTTDAMPGSAHSSDSDLSGIWMKAPSRVAVRDSRPFPTRTRMGLNEIRASRATSSEEKFHSVDSTKTLVPPEKSTLLLEYSEIWNAKGLHTLPFFGCGDRIFKFYGFSTPASLEALNLYQKLRTCAPPERWSDLHGNAITCGRVLALDKPEVNIGPVLASQLTEPQDIGECSYVLIRKAKCTRYPWEKGESAYLDGDCVYQWVSYVSLEHAQAGVVDSLSSGFSIVGNWVELDVSKVGTATLARLAGKKFIVEKRRIFAAVDAANFTSFMGWREKMRILCA